MSPVAPHRRAGALTRPRASALGGLPLDRRALLRAGLFAGGLAALGPGLAGCGSPVEPLPPGDASPPTPVSSRAVTPSLPGTAEGVPDAYFDYPADPPRVTSGVPGDGSVVTGMVTTYSPVPPGPGANSYWRELNRRLGVDLRLQITPNSDFQSKFATVVAGGALPDLMQLGASPLMPLLLQTRCVDLSDHLSGDAAQRYPNLAGLGTEAWRAGIVNGRIYGVPVPRGTISADGMFRRDDLLAARGISGEPADFEELLALFTEVTAPAEGRWALTGVPYTNLGPMAGVPNAWRLSDDGALTSQWEGEEQERCIDLATRLLQAGVVHPDWASSSSQKQWLGNGTCLYHQDSLNAWQQFYRENTAGESFDVGTVLLPQADGGGLANVWRGAPAFHTSVVTQGNEQRLEMLLSVLDHLASPFGSEEYLFLNFGLPGDHYELDGTNPVLSPSGAAQTALGVRYLTEGPKVIYIPGVQQAARKLHAHLSATVPVSARNPVQYVYSEAESRYGPRLTTQMNNARNDVVTGRATMRDWRQAVADWRAGGGDDMKRELLTALEETPEDLRPLR